MSQTEAIKRIIATERTVAANEIIARLAEILAQLSAVKPLYDEADALVCDLVRTFGANAIIPIDEDTLIQLTDNFAEKNTCFRAHGIKRFEAKLLTPAELEKIEAREAKRMVKGA